MNFSLGHKNTIVSTQQPLFYSTEQAFRHLLLCVRVRAKSCLARVRKNTPSRQRAKIHGTVRRMRHTSRQDSTTGSKTRADTKENSPHTKGINGADHGTHIDSVLREIYDGSTPSNCDGGLEDHVTKRQPDLATRMMLEQASLSSNGDYDHSTTLQLSLDGIDRAVEPITESVSVRERSTHSEH